jgi:hypothetical protein
MMTRRRFLARLAGVATAVVGGVTTLGVMSRCADGVCVDEGAAHWGVRLYGESPIARLYTAEHLRPGLREIVEKAYQDREVYFATPTRLVVQPQNYDIAMKVLKW